ncbi:DUF5959 family protein [Streptomyces sp. NPDC059171]|uniref:DUF5959 family protein n=1 Tax=Streptomyces sp. NPDC059171 TaxID=3346755 RepID=UPI00369A6E5A
MHACAPRSALPAVAGEDLSDWGRLLDAIEEDEQEADLDEPFTADWPRSGRTAYLRFTADDPYVVEVHDGPSTQIVVSVPLDMREEWIAESRERLAAARAARHTSLTANSPSRTTLRLLDNDDWESVTVWSDQSRTGCRRPRRQPVDLWSHRGRTRSSRCQ